jgi:hypothetical protein
VSKRADKLAVLRFTADEKTEIIDPTRELGAAIGQVLTRFVDYIQSNSQKNEDNFLDAVDEAIVIGASYLKEGSDDDD